MKYGYKEEFCNCFHVQKVRKYVNISVTCAYGKHYD